jgi:hypothetical protein
MNRDFSLIKKFPFLRKILCSLIPKFLDFTDYPEQRALLKLLIEERNLKLQYSTQYKILDSFNLKLIDLITTNSFPDIDLIRVGPANDGGYFLPTSFSIPVDWITIGLGTNVIFENHLALRNCKVYSFDHTVPGRPSNLVPEVNFYPYGWGNDQKGSKLISLNSMIHLCELNFHDDSNWCLKFDIEGNEWELIPEIIGLENTPALIICELHNLIPEINNSKHLEKLATLESLLNYYIICSTHGNNYSKYLSTTKYGLYDVIEFTLIRRDLINECKLNPDSINTGKYKNFDKIIQMPIGRII